MCGFRGLDEMLDNSLKEVYALVVVVMLGREGAWLRVLCMKIMEAVLPSHTARGCCNRVQIGLSWWFFSRRLRWVIFWMPCLLYCKEECRDA